MPSRPPSGRWPTPTGSGESSPDGATQEEAAPAPEGSGPSVCPRSRRPNRCGVVDGRAASCWCRDVTAEPDLRAAGPVVGSREACLCRGCLEGHAWP
ncbi:MAG: hypothetical protein EA352_02580 [Gemmatimonadales bacterium]|nr:MAG: hypothetical protein EA352_02580 [Gemmatimonadales bacterium]